MNSVDWSLYDEEAVPSATPKERSETSKTKEVDWGVYDPESEEKPYIGQYKHLTPSQYQKLSPEKKKELQNYVPLTGFAKGIAKGATLGYSELIPGLKVEEHEVGAGPGEFVGMVAPIGLIGKALSFPFRALQGLYNFSKPAQAGLRIAQSATTGGLYGAGKETAEVAKGNEFSVGNVASEAATFGVLHGLFEATPAAYKWVKSLKPKQQSQMLVEGIIPDNLTPSEYKFYESEVVPELQKAAEAEYKNSLEKAVQENDAAYKTKLENTKAEFEQGVYERAQKNEMNESEYNKSQEEYRNKLKQVAAEQENKVAEIQKQNQEAMKAFEDQKKDFDNMKSRQNAVQSAIQAPQATETSLTGRVSPQGQDVGFRPAPGVDVNPSVENRVGSVISPLDVKSTAPNRQGNTTTAGETTIQAVRANDAHDYNLVRQAYQQSEQLNAQVTAEQPQLANQLRTTLEQLNSIPEPSPPQKQLQSTIQKILNQIENMDKVTGEGILQPISNRVLQEQAKSLRYFMDFNFEHGNSRGIFSPTVKALEDAIEQGARSVGNMEAVDANRNARALYSQWAEMYDNPYIKPYRDTGNLSPSDTFKKGLTTDNFNALDIVLNRSNAGQQVAGINRRALVEKQLEPYLRNPRKANLNDFYKELDELRAVASPEEIITIRDQFLEARKSSKLSGRKFEPFEEPKAPKIKELPTKTDIPKSTARKPEPIAEPTEVKIPTKGKVKTTPEMKAAAQLMKITEEQAIKLADTPSGLKKLKQNMPDKIYKEIGKRKIKDILYEGKVEHQFKGDELYNQINKGENYDLLVEILGEDEAADLLVSSREIANKKVTVEALKKAGMKIGTLKTLLVLGLI